MSGKRAFEEQIAALEALRQAPAETRVVPLRKALTHRNNFIAAKAADLVREFGLTQLAPDLLKAFDHFLENPEKSDPQCWAKNAISRALAAFEHQDADVFLRGMRHIQMEPVWGGQSDTAGTLRATCALALVQCRSLGEMEVLRHLVDLAGDSDKTVRAEVMRAVEQMNSSTASLLLRLKALVGDAEPEVLGACFAGILQIDGVKAIPWVARFLGSADDKAAEAALAIAGTHTPEAFIALQQRLDRSHDLRSLDLKSNDPWFRSVLLSAVALTRQDAAHEFLMSLVQTESRDAEPAMEALLRTRPSAEVIERIEKLVSGNPRLVRTFATLRKQQS
jgi:HEAT repeat protein